MKPQIFLTSIFIIVLSLSLVSATTYIGAETEPWIVPPFSEATYIIGQYNGTHYYAKNFTGYGTDANAGYEFLSRNATDVIVNTVSSLTNGGTIFVGAATYDWNIADYGFASNIIFKGDGINTKIVANASIASNMFYINQKSNITFSQLHFIGNGAAMEDPLYFLNCSNVLVENCIFENVGEEGLSFMGQNSSNQRAEGNTFLSWDKKGVGNCAIETDTKDLSITGNFADGGNSNATANGYYLKGQDISLTDNRGQNMKTFICVSSPINFAVTRNIKIEGNIGWNTSDTVIALDYGNSITVSDNKIYNAASIGSATWKYGCRLYGTNNSQIIGNTFSDDQSVHTQYAGIQIQTGSCNNTVYGNTLQGNLRYAIRIGDANSKNNSIIYNNVKWNAQPTYDAILDYAGAQTIIMNNPGFDVVLTEIVLSKISGSSSYVSQTVSGSIISTSTSLATVLNDTVGAYRHIYVPNGHYDLLGRVVISTSYLTVEGESYGGVQLDYGAQGVISLEGTASLLGIIFKNINFTDGGTTALNPAISSVNQTDNSRVELELDHCKISGFRNNGVYMLNIKNGERVRLLHSNFDSEGRITSWNGSLINMYSEGYYQGNWEFSDNYFNARFAFGCAINISGSILPNSLETQGIVSQNNQFYFDQTQYKAYMDVNYAYWLNTAGGNLYGFRSIADRTENTNFLNSTGLNDTARCVIQLGNFGLPSNNTVSTANSTYPFIWLGRYSWSWIISDNTFYGGRPTTVCIKDSNIYSTRFNNIHSNDFRTSSGSPTWVIASADGTEVHHNTGFVTENAGSEADCINGTAIAHGLAGTPTTITISIAGTNPYVNNTAWYFVPTVLSMNSTHFIVSFCMNIGGTYTPVGAGDAKTIFWDAVYKP